MKIEKAQAEFKRLINKHNFTVGARTIDSGIPVYHRVWNRGNETLEIRILLSGEYPLMSVIKNDKPDPRFIRDYQNSKKRIQRNTQNHNSSRIRNVKRHKENDHTRAINSVWSLIFAPV